MRNTLFRQEAVEGMKPRLEGQVLAARPGSFLRIVRLVVALVLALFAASFFVTIPIYLSVSGQLRSEAGLFHVRAPSAGVLEIQGGTLPTQVKSGQVLAVVRSTASTSDGVSLADAKRDLLDRRRQSVEDRVASSVLETRHAADKVEQQIAGIEANLHSSREAVIAARSLFDLARQQEERTRALFEQGVVTRQSLDDAVRSSQERRLSVLQAEQSVRRLESDGSALRAELSSLRARASSIQSEGRAALLDGETAAVDLKQMGGSPVASPIDGEIVAVAARSGAVQQNELLFVVSSTDRMEAVAVIPESVAQRVQVGAKVGIRVHGTSAVEGRTGVGRVEDVSKGVVALQGGDQPLVGHVAKISIDRAEFRLSPGARVLLKLQVKEQIVFKWLFSKDQS